MIKVQIQNSRELSEKRNFKFKIKAIEKQTLFQKTEPLRQQISVNNIYLKPEIFINQIKQ